MNYETKKEIQDIGIFYRNATSEIAREHYEGYIKNFIMQDLDPREQDLAMKMWEWEIE